MQKTIHFYSDGMNLTGNLYFPGNIIPGKKYPAIIVGGSWTTVKEQMSGLYAKRLSQYGFITLAFDPRYFGESEGWPRYWENPEAKIEDYKNSISFLQTINEVNPEEIFLTAICASAGYMAAVAAKDERIRGLATIAAWLHDENTVKMIYGGEKGVKDKIYSSETAQKAFNEQGEVKYIPTISTTDTSAAMFGEYDYYLNPLRGAVPQWSADKFAIISWKSWLTFNPMPLAASIKQPVLMVHSDDAVLPENAKQFFCAIPHSKKVLHWMEGNQFDFYDSALQVTEAIAAVSVFFKTLITSPVLPEKNVEIIQQIKKLFAGADERNWQLVMSVMNDKVMLDYSSMNGNPATKLTPQAITETWSAFLPGFDKTHHLLWGFEVNTENDNASVHFTGRAEHWISNECWTVEGTYDLVLVFKNNQWLIIQMKFNFIKQTGNTGLPVLASQNVKR